MSNASHGTEAVVPSGDDALQKVRISFIQRATLTHGGRAEQVFLMDLGVRGVFVERGERLAVGERVEVRFRLPGNDIPVVAHCRVAWWHAPDQPLVSKRLPPGLGLEFLDVSPRDRRRIRDYLAEYLERDPRERQFQRQWPEADARERTHEDDR